MAKSTGGLSSLIPNTDEIESKATKKAKVKSKSAAKKNVTNNNFNIILSSDKIDEIKEEVVKNPRISLWSLKSAATFRYLKKTIPEFSISKEAALLLEDAISSKYPEIWELFEDIE